MIVQPDFLDHWKTLRLASVLSDPLAPIYVIRLWCYVQTSRRDVLPDDAEMVKAVCRWPGCAVTFCDALLSCGWLERTGSGLLVHGWSELNARLIHNWTVGPSGGRPRLQSDKPKGKPKGSPQLTDKSRVEEIRLDESRVESTSAGAVAPPEPPKPVVKAKTFKTWTAEEFATDVARANADKTLTDSEAEDFISYWTEPTATGRLKLATESTWDTHRRMLTAVRAVYAKRRTGAETFGRPAAQSSKPATVWELTQRRDAIQQIITNTITKFGLDFQEGRERCPSAWAKVKKHRDELKAIETQIAGVRE